MLRYLLIGLLSVAVDIGLLYVLHDKLHVEVAAATATAFIASLLVNFVLNRRHMAPAGMEHMSRHAVRYGILVLANLAITVAVVSSAAAAGISYLWAKLAVVASSTIWNFVLYRHWVFTSAVPGEGAGSVPVGHPNEPGPTGCSALMHGAERSQLLVVIPALNEEDSVGTVVAEIRECMPDASVLVVDDGSSDHTRERALASGAMVASLPINLGVGGAMRTGFLFALRHGYDIVVQVDGDGQHDPRQIELLVKALHEADVVIGARFAGEGNYEIRGPRRWAMRVLSVALSRIAKTKLSDTTSGFRASNARAIELFAKHYPAEYLGDTVESVVIAARSGLRIRQVPVDMRSRAAGRPSQPPWRAMLYLFRALMALIFAGIRQRGIREVPPRQVTEAPPTVDGKEAT